MAITGYESDQVQRTPTGDIPLPITAAYSTIYPDISRVAVVIRSLTQSVRVRPPLYGIHQFE